MSTKRHSSHERGRRGALADNKELSRKRRSKNARRLRRRGGRNRRPPKTEGKMPNGCLSRQFLLNTNGSQQACPSAELLCLGLNSRHVERYLPDGYKQRLPG